MVDLPPGFTLQKKATPGGGPALPPGFSLQNDTSMPDVSKFKDVPEAQLRAAVEAARTGREKAAYDELPFWKRNLFNIFDAGNFMTRGATAGLIEKGAALARTPFTDKTFAEELDAQRAITAHSRARQGTGGQALGEMTGGVMAFKGIPQASGGAIVRGAQGAAEGAGFGAASAYADDRPILRGAGEGAAFGAGTSALLDVVRAGGKPVMDQLINFATKPDSRAYKMVMDAIKQTGATRQQIETIVRDLGTPSALVDALGKHGADLGRAMSNISSKARGTAEDFVAGRKGEQNVRVAGSVEQAAGLPPGSRKTVDDLVKEAAAKRKPAVDAAYQAARDKGAVLPTEGFREIFATPAGKDAMKAAQITLKNRAPMRGEGEVSMLEILDQAKRELDASATAAYSRGEKQAGETYSGLGRTLRERIDAAMAGGEYETARKLRQEGYQEEEAIRKGGDLAKPNKPLDVTAQVEAVTPQNRGALKQGYGAGTVQQLLNQKPGEGVLNSLNTPLAREAASSVFENDAQILRDQLAREQTMATTNRDLVGNSSTARQQSMIEKYLPAAVGGGLGSAALDIYNNGLSDPWGTFKKSILGASVLGAGRAGYRRLNAAGERQLEATAPEVMDILLGKQMPQLPPGAQRFSPFWDVRPAVPTRNDLVHTAIVGSDRLRR